MAGWTAGIWDFTGSQYRDSTYERLGDLYDALNERMLAYSVIWGFNIDFLPYSPRVQPESWRDSRHNLNSPRGPYYQLTYLKSVVKSMLASNVDTHGWINEAEIATVGTLKQWMDANTIITPTTYTGSPYTNIPVFYNETIIPTDGGTGAGTLAKLLTDLGLPTNYFDYTPYRPWHEPCDIPSPVEVEMGFNLWDYGEYGLYLILKNMKRFVEINADTRYTPYIVQDWTHTEADGRDSIGTGSSIISYADSINLTNGLYPLYSNPIRLPYNYTYSYKARAPVASGFNWKSYAAKVGKSYIPNEYLGTAAVGYPITMNFYPLLYAMGSSAENFWKGWGTNGPFFSTNEYNWIYQANEIGYTVDEWNALTPQTVIVNGLDVTVNSPEIGQSASTMPTIPAEPNSPAVGMPYNLNINSGGCHPFAGFKSWSVHEPVLSYV